ncbi:MAG: transglutaminase family protein [Desulfobacterales bacterium]|nr:transglutaminase family protein [Desulfobacterales bacterium]
MENFEIYLNPTEVIDSDHPSIIDHALKSYGNAKDEISKACALFTVVRDDVVYDPQTPFYLKSHYQASNVLERGSGYCVSKACLLCALGRASGIPSRLGFADIRNHGASQEIVDLMGTNIFTFHGFVEFFLDGRWVKATPAFDRTVYEKHHIPLVTFDGRNDAVLPSHNLNGNLYVEYIKYHGSFADFPLEDLLHSFTNIYGNDRVDQWIKMLESEMPS